MVTRTEEINSVSETVDTILIRSLGARIRRLRANRGYSRKELSALADVSERHLAQLETGKGNISVILLSRVARALGTDLSELFRDDKDSDSMEDIMLADLVQQINPADRHQAVELLRDRFVTNGRQKRRLALIGLRGAGKTTLGSRLAREYKRPFIQLASEIERLAGMNVSEIFSLSGEDYYRRLEEKALIETLKRHDDCIIETGGSIVTELNLLNLLLKSCHVVWLSASAEEHMQRVIDQGDMRPIENNDDAMSDLRRLMQQRTSFYQQAHAHIDTSARTVDESMAELYQVFPR